METNIIQVLLVDDHPVVRSGYRRLLENTLDIKVIYEATSGEEAYTAYVKHHPDAVIMDLSMEGMGGLAAIRKIRRYDKSARILVFSVHENETFLNHALNEGAFGYISKRSAAKVMIEAVRKVAQGKTFIGQEMQPYLVNNISSENEAHLSDKLSPREFEVYQLLAQGKSVIEIAQILNLSPKTVGHHYTHVKKKLNVANLAELTQLAIREKLIEP